MEMLYAALLLHSLGKEINESHIKKVMEAAGASADEAQIKALVSNLKNVNIADAIKGASFVQAAAPAEKPREEKAESKKEEKQEDKTEEAAAGLGALFG
jgi:large subunit ribosomal protein L12